MLPINEEFIEYLIENTNISQEVFIMLLDKVNDETESLSITREMCILNHHDEDETMNNFFAKGRSATRFSPSLVYSVVRHFDRSVVDSILDTFDFQIQSAVIMENFLRAAVGNRFHESDVMRTVLAHCKVDLVVSYAAVKISLEHFDADLVRRLMNMAKIELDQSLLISATGNQVYEVVSVVLQFDSRIPIDERVLRSAIDNSKHGKTIVAALLSYVGIGALSLSVMTIQLAIQNDCFSLQLLKCLRDVSIVISALHELIEGTSLDEDLSYLYSNVFLGTDTVQTRVRESLLVLLNQQERGITVTADLLQVARKNAMPQEVLERAFKSKLNQIRYTPELFAEAASWLGRSTMQALSDNCDNIPVAGIEKALVPGKNRIGRTSRVQSPADWHPVNDIILAIRHNDNNALRTLLRRTAQATTRKEYEDFVCTAVNNNNVVALKSLLSMQRELNQSIDDHGKALFRAVIRGCAGAVKVFLDHGVNANARGEYNMPVLCAAVFVAPRANTDTSRATNSSDDTPEEILRLLLGAGADVDARNGQSSTALQIAVDHGNLRVVKMLLAAGADVNACGGLYDRVLINAASSQRDSPDIIRLLIEYGATFHPATGGLEVLHSAIREHKDRTIHLLLSHWTWPRFECQKPLLPQHTVFEKSTICLLLRHGVEVDGADGEGQTCVHRAVTQWALLRDAVWIMNVVLDAGAQVNKPTNDGQTPLHWASHYARTRSIVTRLLDFGARMEEVDQYGCTALHVALYSENRGTARILLQRGARTDVPDLYGITAIQLLSCDLRSSTFVNTDSDQSDSKHRVVALMHILRHINSIKIAKIVEKVDTSFFTSWIWGRLALWLFRVQQLEEATTALENPVFLRFSDTEPLSWVICDRCKRDELKGFRHKCGVCDDCDLCDKCWTEQENILKPPCCVDHKSDFIHAPGPSWKDRPAGVVNDRHESLKEWIARVADMCSRELEELTQKDRQSERHLNSRSEIEECSENPTIY